MKFDTKYDRGDIVFYMDKNEVKANNILAIDIRHQYKSGNEYETIIKYKLDGRYNGDLHDLWVLERLVFISKEELLKSF